MGLTALAGGLLAAEAVREVYAFEVSRQARSLRGLRELLRVALLTDFHLGPFLHARQLSAWVEASNAADPDLVIVGGDLVDRFYRGDLTELTAGLARLRQRLGVIVVPGNHDRTRYPDLVPLVKAVEAAGATMLVNRAVRPRPDLVVGGVDDFRKGHSDPRRAFRDAAGADGARVLVSHNPDILPTLGPDVGPLDLVLCGHTHGGQVRLPLIGPLVTSSEYGARYAEGWVEASQPSFVSRGLGVTLLPFRFDCAPEVVVLDLLPA